MGKSHNDAKRYKYKHHSEVCTKYYATQGYYCTLGKCECDLWPDWHWYLGPVPAWWNKGIRRQERSFARNRMQRARAGHVDWAAVDDRKGDEYYW